MENTPNGPLESMNEGATNTQEIKLPPGAKVLHRVKFKLPRPSRRSLLLTVGALGMLVILGGMAFLGWQVRERLAKLDALSARMDKLRSEMMRMGDTNSSRAVAAASGERESAMIEEIKERLASGERRMAKLEEEAHAGVGAKKLVAMVASEKKKPSAKASTKGRKSRQLASAGRTKR